MGADAINQVVKGIRAVAQSPVTGQFTTAAGRWLMTPVPTARIWVLISNLAEGALVGVVLSAIYTDRKRAKQRLAADQRASALVPSPPPARVAGPIEAGTPYESMERYFSTERALEGHFAEVEEFHRQAAGRRIRWQGLVAHVYSHASGSVGLLLRCGDDDLRSRLLITATFPESFRERLFALPAGRLVRVLGTLTQGTMADGRIRIDGESFELVIEPPPAPGSSERPVS